MGGGLASRSTTRFRSRCSSALLVRCDAFCYVRTEGTCHMAEPSYTLPRGHGLACSGSLGNGSGPDMMLTRLNVGAHEWMSPQRNVCRA